MDSLVVADGSSTDCQRLIELFTREASPELRFGEFVKKWQTLNFNLILCGRSSQGESDQLTLELFFIAKGILLNSDNFASKVGGLYLLYGIYYHQKTRTKIRLTVDELRDMILFLEEIKHENMKEPEFIFQKLFVDNAFIFCATSNEFSQMNPKQLSNEDQEAGESVDGFECRLLECEGFSVDNISEIDVLHSKYEEIKSQIPGLVLQNSAASSNKNFVADLCATINTLKSNININKVCNIKQLKVSSNEASDSQGVIRRNIVSCSFRAPADPYRLPASTLRKTSSSQATKRRANN